MDFRIAGLLFWILISVSIVPSCLSDQRIFSYETKEESPVVLRFCAENTSALAGSALIAELITNFTEYSGAINSSSSQLDFTFDNLNCSATEVSFKLENINFGYNNNTVSSHLTPEGYFYTDGTYYPPGAFCFSSISIEDGITVKACSPNCGHEDACVKKCCPLGQVYRYDLSGSPYLNGTCVEINGEDSWSPFFSTIANVSGDGGIEFGNMSMTASPVEPYYFLWKPKCEVGRPVKYSPHPKTTPAYSVEFHLLSSSQIFARQKGQQIWSSIVVKDQSCVDGLWDSSSSQDFEETPENQIILSCLPELNFFERNFITILVVLFYLLCVAATFLFLTVVVYIILWSQHNIHGWTITVFCSVMFSHFTLEAGTLGILLYQTRIIGSVGCIVLGTIQHFFVIASFSWLDVLSFDIWYTIRSTCAPASRSRGRRRFAVYNLVGFGIPALVVFASWMVQIFGDKDQILKPNYGVELCNVSTGALYYYETVVSMVIFVFNCLFVMLAAVTLFRAQRAGKKAGSSSTKRNRSQVMLLAKLFIIMGLSWLFSFLTPSGQSQTGQWLILVFLYFNVVRGVALFWIFTAQKKIWIQLKRQFVDKGKVFSTQTSRTSQL